MDTKIKVLTDSLNLWEGEEGEEGEKREWKKMVEVLSQGAPVVEEGGEWGEGSLLEMMKGEVFFFSSFFFSAVTTIHLIHFPPFLPSLPPSLLGPFWDPPRPYCHPNSSSTLPPSFCSDLPSHLSLLY